MKHHLLLLAVCMAGTTAFGSDTAYTALRVIGKQQGKESLGRVVEVRGNGGAPSPKTWRVTLQDNGARGGIREYELQGGKVTSERTPTARPLSPPMNFNQLNLDSDGVFSIANDEAAKAGVSFDHVDYTLHSGGHAGVPIWRLDLFDSQSGRVGTYEIAADTGAILHKDTPAPGRVSTYGSTHPPVAPPPPPRTHDTYADRANPDRPPERPYTDRPYTEHGYPDSPHRHYESNDDDDDYDGPGFLEKVKNHFQKRARQFDNFFNGRGWSDQ